MHKTKKYLAYALGEILLVVIGILLALQINNWNEQQKAHDNEILILQSFATSIERDLGNYRGLFLNRMQIKKNAIDSLKKYIGIRKTLPDSLFMRFYHRLNTDIVGRFDSGPFDALKSNGLNQISNPELRKLIVHTYQVNLPAFMLFLSFPEEDYNDLILQLENEILTPTLVANAQGGWDIKQVPKNPSVLFDTRLLQILHKQTDKYDNYISRIESIDNILSNVLVQIQKELDSKQTQ